MSKKQRKSNQKNTELLALFTEKDLRLYRMNEFKKVLKEKNGIPMLLSYMCLDKEVGKFQLNTDFPYHIFGGGQIIGIRDGAVLTEEEVLIYIVTELEALMERLKKRLAEEKQSEQVLKNN